MTKTCKGSCGRDLPEDNFEPAPSRNGSTYRRGTCRACRGKRTPPRIEAGTPRLDGPEFAAGVANIPDRNGTDKAERKRASEEKRQEFNRKMAQTAGEVAEIAAGARVDPSEEALDYLLKLSESEASFGNRRIARSVSLSLAHELLGIRMFKKAADQWLSGRVAPEGYAARPRPDRVDRLDRTLVVDLSDLHLGARLSDLDNPVGFRRTEESRRLGFILSQALDYKPQYRERTLCKLLLNGDVIQGMLLHDMRDGAPLVEQKAIFWELMSQFVARLGASFPLVDVHCSPGNHGRDKLRHPGRATSSKWDGHEWECYYALSRMASELKNVTWDMPFRAVTLVDIYGKILAVTHGDTEVPLGNPTTQHDRNVAQLQKIAATRILDCEPDAWAVGHFHSAALMPGNPTVVYNGMLVPPDGHARTMGYIDKPCGQWLWEAVRGHVVGDSRFVRVGPEQDRDASLDRVLAPANFPESL